MQYQVKDPSGQLHIIEGPNGASAGEVIAQAQKVIPKAPVPEATPIMDTVQKTAELGGTVFGGIAGGAAGTFGAGPVGTLVGGVAGAAAGHALGTAASNVVRNYMSPSQTPSLGDQFKDVAQSGAQGAEDQATGEAVGAVAKPIISSLGDAINSGLAKLSTWKLGASVPEKAAEIAKEAKFNIPSATQEDIEAGVSNVQKALTNSINKAGETLNKAKSDIGIPVSVADKEASLLQYGNTHGLGPDVINDATQEMLDSKTPEELSANIAKFKQMQTAGNSDPALTARVANALQNKIGDFVDFTKPGNDIEGVLKKQYGDLGRIVQDNAMNLKGAKSNFSEVKDLFDDLETQLASDKDGKAEQFLRNLFTKDTPVNRGYLDKLAQLEHISGKPVISDLFKQFTGEAFDKTIGSPKLASAAAAAGGEALLHTNIPTALSSAGYLAAQSPALIKTAGKASANITQAALDAVNNKAGTAGIIGLNSLINDEVNRRVLQSVKDRVKNNR